MPFYEYRCTACGHQDSFLERMDAPQQKTCPECRKRRAFKRLVSAAGFQLKGDGWYVTDFKNNDKKKPAKSDTPDSGKTPDATAKSANTEKPAKDKPADKKPDNKKSADGKSD